MGLHQGGQASARLDASLPPMSVASMVRPATENALRVLLVDEHELVREAIQSILERGIEVVAIAKNAAQAFSAVNLHSPDVVLVCVKAKSIQEESDTARALATLASTDGHSRMGEPASNTVLVSRPADADPHRRDQAANRRIELTPRERQVLTLLIAGATNKEMARHLSIRSNTVRTHVQSLLTKLHVHTRLGAATLAMREGLL
jgi:two-component system, NarL family, nitrate/nitrite response regulator NarL